MRILHTSDWHLGRKLYGRSRYDEFEAFLGWLGDTIARERVEALLIAGDVFDTSAPGNRAQALYYRFLCRMAESDCRHVVVIAGNHDSPSFIDAPDEILAALRIHVVGAARAPGDEVLVLDDADGAPGLIVCAVPYLRDRDIRTAAAGERPEDKAQQLVAGVRAHYAEAFNAAEARRADLDAGLPIVGMGHLFTTGGRVAEGDGVRELYVGNLARVRDDQLPAGLDYLALGHLHLPQVVGGDEARRYCGAPLPMGFGEAGQEKQVCLVDFEGRKPTVRTLAVPRFQDLERVRGDLEAILARIRALAGAGSKAWLEVVYDGEEILGDLRARLDEAVAGTGLEILRVKNERVIERYLGQTEAGETLDALTPDEVFERCLDAHEVPEEQRGWLRATHHEALASLLDDDPEAD